MPFSSSIVLCCEGFLAIVANNSINHRIVTTQSRTYQWLVVLQPTCDPCQHQENCSCEIQVLGLNLFTLYGSYANQYETYQCY